MNKIAAYKLREEGYDTVDANLHLGFDADERDYGVGAQILREIGVKKMKLMTNNPVKRIGLEAYGLEITENVGIEIKPNPYNERYRRLRKIEWVIRFILISKLSICFHISNIIVYFAIKFTQQQ